VWLEQVRRWAGVSEKDVCWDCGRAVAPDASECENCGQDFREVSGSGDRDE
jgi:uncharacterized OB-fold protein